MSDLKGLFDDEIKAFDKAVMNLHNAASIGIEPGDPRNLDPEDEALAGMYFPMSDVEAALDRIQDKMQEEHHRRTQALDDMSEEEMEKWQAAVDG